MAFVKNLQLLFVLISVHMSAVLCSCPVLQPNQNVLVTCLSYDSTSDRHQRANCDLNNGQRLLNPGLTVEYQCEKYFTPISSAFFKGRMHCGQNGWIHLKEFKEFSCKPDCGKQPNLPTSIGTLISDGKSIKRQSSPWVATIFRSSIKGFVYECGGSLIGLQTILTAAHCVADAHMNKLPISLLKVGVGNVGSKLDKDFEINGYGRDFYSVEDIWIHPDYHPQTLTKDIAIIQLAESVSLSDSVLPVCLPNSFTGDALATSAGNHGEVASFGSDESGKPTDTLQFGSIPVLSSDECFRELKTLPRTEEYCAGNDVGPKMCRGDSGSGMVFRSTAERKYFVHGIVSNGGPLLHGCARFVVISRVFTYLQWIQDTLRQTESMEENGNNQRKYNNTTFNEKRRSVFEPKQVYTNIELNALAQLRPMVQNIVKENYMLKNEYLIRFLRAKKFNLVQAKKFLQTSINWRNQNRINEIRFEDFSKFRTSFPVLMQGYDNSGNPIAVHLFGRYNLKSINQSEMEPFLRCIERDFEEISWKIRERNASNCFAIFDLLGFNRRQHLCAQCFVIYLHFITIYENYYPQLCHATYFINVPPVYEQALHVFQPILTEHTKKTLKYFGTNKEEWSKELLKHIPKDQLFTEYGGIRTVVMQGANKGQITL